MNPPQFPSGLKSAMAIAATIPGIAAETLIELAAAGYLPHWRVNGGDPLFQVGKVKQWLAENLLNYSDGQPFPINMRVLIDAPPAEDAPLQIREIPGLQALPAYSLRPGVYFLVDQGEVVYVGQSMQPMARIAMHGDKQFDRVYLKPIPSRSLDAVEGALIRLLKPKLNGWTRSGQRIFCAPGASSQDVDVLEQLMRGSL